MSSKLKKFYKKFVTSKKSPLGKSAEGDFEIFYLFTFLFGFFVF